MISVICGDACVCGVHRTYIQISMYCLFIPSLSPPPRPPLPSPSHPSRHIHFYCYANYALENWCDSQTNISTGHLLLLAGRCRPIVRPSVIERPPLLLNSFYRFSFTLSSTTAAACPLLLPACLLPLRRLLVLIHVVRWRKTLSYICDST